MFTSLLGGLFVLAGFLFLGLFLALPIARGVAAGVTNRGPLVLAIAIAIGFGLSGIAASWSYGLVGADNYVLILGILFLSTLIPYFKQSFRGNLILLREFSKADSILLLIPLFATFMSKPYWSGLFDQRVSAGPGPDIPQNMMTFLGQPRIGQTWTESKNGLLNFLGDENLGSAIYHLYQLPSMQDQAAYDYLVYGTRWGLSIPASQLLRIDSSLLIGIQGVILISALTSLALIVYSFSLLMNNSVVPRYLLTVASISSGAFFVQVFNGGMAQAWSLPGLGLISFAFLITLIRNSVKVDKFRSQVGLVIMFTFGWLGNAVSYIDSSMTLAVVIAVVISATWLFVGRKIATVVASVTIAGGLLAAVVVFPYSWAAIQTMSIRLTLASGTGIKFNHWPLPSELLGIFDIWNSQPGTAREPITFLLGLMISFGMLVLVSRGIRSRGLAERSLSVAGITIFLIGAAIAAWAFQTSVQSNYTYIKVSTYMAPMLLMIFSEKIAIKRNKFRGSRKLKSLEKLEGVYIIAFATLAIVSTSYTVNNTLVKNAEFLVPKPQLEILKDKEAQAQLENYNYLSTYRAISNLLGVIGNTHWVSKAPNDQRLEGRLDKEMRIICFAADQICKPPTSEIIVPSLNKYGLKVYSSNISTQEFYSLAPRERYYASMDAVGQPRFEVPERFIGGNPLLKAND